ncbi:GerAB/ArcD/ProY family transporter [Paenibacillus sp. 1001270B_150601_E10]|uniref:GerAB/ArcD/ProY family transporter n=1 Tax=Paenibacillus sp. 1001270B_150601_E10 TaxID=2787079 RepID=UPI00189EA1A5|nr:endospore germination permease [Paenibacillus sp. 1001270B_150601_E10]
MLQPTQISVRQFQILVTLYTVGTSILIMPAALAANLKQDAWLAPLIAIGPGLLLVLLYNRINSAAPGATIFELCESILGNWIGRMVSLLIVVFFFLESAMVLYDVGNFITTVIMPETPISFLNFLFAILVITAIRSGFNTFARMVELLFPLFILFFLMIVMFLSPQIDFYKAQPFLVLETNNLIYSILMVMSFSFMPLVVFLVVIPKTLKHPTSGSIGFYKAVLIGGGISVIVITLTILVLGSNIASLKQFPVYYLARKISVGRFLERVEAMVAIMWLITTFVKLSLYFFASVSGLVHIARLKSERSVLMPMGFILVILSVDIFPNSVYEAKFNSADWIVSISCVGVILPLFLLIVKLWKDRNKKKSDNSA